MVKTKKTKTEFLPATDFLKSSRLDLVPKIWYIKNKYENINADFFIKMYLEHIRAFNHFTENHKKTKEDFLMDFDSLITSIKRDGFKENISIIPSTQNKTIIDGAHRTASSIFFGNKIGIERFKDAEGPNYNYNYFKKRGLSENIIEEMIFKYLDLKKENLYACIFWGSSLGRFNEKEIFSELERDNINVVYSKEISLTERGKKNLVIACYEDEPWISDKGKNFSGATRKVVPCFKGSNKIRFMLLESEDKQNVIDFKKNVRDRLKMGNHAMHTSDTVQEARDVCSLLLNKNSRFFLNYGEKMILPEALDKKHLKVAEDFAVTSSHVLEMFGLRKAEDIDYITRGKKEVEGLGSHNYYFNVDQLNEYIHNPDNFFRFKGIKFVTLENISKFKQKRGEKKDRRDVLLIGKFLGDKNKFDYKEKIFIIQMKGVSLILKLIKKIPQDVREKIKKNKLTMSIYRKLFC